MPITRRITSAISRSLTSAVTEWGGGGVDPRSISGLVAWYEPRDFAQLYQNSAGSTPVTAVEQPVGRAMDLSGNGNHATQATAGLRPTISARKNQHASTEDMSAAYWAKVSGGTGVAPVVTANYGLAPDGVSMTADRVQLSIGAGTTTADQTALIATVSGMGDGTTRTQSVYVKSLTTPVNVLMRVNGTSTALAVGTDWTRISVTAGSADASCWLIALRGSLGTSQACDVLVWGAQLEAGSLVSSYQRVNSASDYDTAADANRINYDGVDDVLVSSFGITPGANCTIVRSVPQFGGDILEGQSIGATYNDSTDHCGLLIYNRALTAAEKDRAATWAYGRAGVPRFVSSIAGWGDSLTFGTGGNADGYLAYLGTARNQTYYNGGVHGQNSTQIKTRMVADASRRRDWVTVLWMGRNDFATPTTVKANIAECVTKLAQNPRYVVCGITTSSADSGASLATIATLNSDLLALYGSRFVDVLAYLQANGDGSANDNADIAAGFIPRSLRSDELHPNDAGYQHIAACIAAKLSSLGY